MRTRTAIPIALALALCANAGGVAGQTNVSFDLSSLEIPSGFFDLQDLTLLTDADGIIIATATTMLGNATANVLVSFAAGGAGLTFGVKPHAWSITEAIPQLSNPVLDGLDFSNVGLVISNDERDVHSELLSDAEWEFYREVYKSDEFRLVLKPGINLIAAFAAEDLGPDHPLTTVMGALGIEKGTILLQGTLGRSLTLLGAPGAGGMDVIKDLYLRAELPPMRPAGSPEWFRSGQLALELTGDPSVRVVGEMNVVMDEEEMMFFLAASLARSGMSLAGGLSVEGGWQQPFGIPWLVLNDVVLVLGITPTGSIQPGFAASLIVGEKDIDVAVSLAISPAGVPTSFMFKGESVAGFGLSDVLQLQASMAAARDAALASAGSAPPASPAIPLDALPNVDFRDVGLQFAPADAPELNVERGMKIKGEMWLPLSASGDMTNFASVDVSVTEDGFWARGHLSAFTAGPLIWEDAELDLTATKEAQHLMLKGDVTLFGARQAVDLTLTREQLTFRTETRLFDMFSADIQARAAFNLRSPDFQVDAVAHADFSDAVGPMVQQGVVAFVGAAADVLAVANAASRAAEQALAIPEATVAQLRAVLEEQRRLAGNALAAANSTAAVRRNAMNAAWAARNRALNVYYATSWYPAWRKAQTLAEYQRANALYYQRAIGYNASMGLVAATQRIYNAIPPVNENIALMRAEEAIAELRRQLQTLQANLSAMETRFAEIEAALERGEMLIVIERAEFHGGLQSALNGDPVRWDIVGEFVGDPFEVHQTMDFSNLGEGAARMLQGLLDR